MDEGDQAYEYELLMRQTLLEKHVKRPLGDFLIVDGKYICIDCGEEIGEKRVKVLGGCERCADCQKNFEEASCAKIH